MPRILCPQGQGSRTVLLLGATLSTLLAAPLAAQPFTSVTFPDLSAHVAFATGATWVDVDGDLDLDLYVTVGFSANNNNVLYRNDGDTFHRVFGTPVVEDSADTACSTWADYDNDGIVDAFVSNLVDDGGMLFHGLAAGGFERDSTAAPGGFLLKGTGCAFGDYDNDGRLDLVVAALHGQGGITTGNRIFHNDGGGMFSEVMGEPPVTTLDSHHHPTWSDYDLDGDLDLFFAAGGVGTTRPDRLYRNQLTETGTATFTPITSSPIATDARDSQVLQWIDYDNDGDLDLFAVNYTSVANQLYRNDAGVFTRLTTGSLVTDLGAHHGAVWGDFDNDGDLDVYVARDSRQSNRYYRNDGGTFTRITTGAFVTEGLSNYGAAAGDFDRDGDLDLFVPTARSEAPSLLFRNELASGARSLVVLPRGRISNRSAVGARIRVRATIGGLPRWQLRVMAAGTNYGGHDALEAHFGLGDALVADTVRIEWPSGIVDVLTDAPAGTWLRVAEGEGAVSVPGLAAAPDLNLVASPVPARDRVTFSLPRADDVPAVFEIFDVSGRRVVMRELSPFMRSRRIEVGAAALGGPGVYLARWRSGGTTTTRRFALLR